MLENAETPVVAADRTLVSRQTEASVTKKFRELLLFGNKKEALEWAMTQGLWGHALFLASKMDQRTYSSVMIRFANGLALTDPLQTLYQLMSGWEFFFLLFLTRCKTVIGIDVMNVRRSTANGGDELRR